VVWEVALNIGDDSGRSVGRVFFILRFHSLFQLVLFVTMAASTMRAQTFTSLSGTVLDTSGAAVAGAQVTISSEGTGAKRSTTTGTYGNYEFSQVAVGQYTLTVEAQGFKQAIREHVGVLVATPTRVDVTLQVGAMGESVSVEADAQTVNTQDASVGTAFSEDQITQLPFAARNPVNLLTLQPGVVFTGSSDTDLLSMGSTQALDPREGVVNGVRGNQSYVSLDGIESNDYQNQSAFTSALPITLDALQEFRVITTNATASSGAAGGAQVEMVTKSGTNQFHGNVRWFNRDTSLAANSFFNNMDSVPRAKLIRNIYGGSVGGPVLKDRLFFFLDYEGRRDRSATPTTRVIPSDSLKAGSLIYQVAGPGTGVIPCPNGAGQYCEELTPTQVAALDPGCSGGTGCGVNPAMLQLMSLYPTGNAPTLGFDGGLTSTGFIFNAPTNTDNSIYTTRLDYKLTRDGRHSIFWRGNLAAIKTDITAAEFPGLPPNNQFRNNSRGMVLGYTAVLSPTLVNNAEWGFVRQGVSETGGTSDSLTAQNFSDPLNFTRGFARTVPTHELRDDISWTHKTHTIQAGADFQLPRNHFTTYQNSYPIFELGDFGFCLNDCHDPLMTLQAEGQQAPLNTTTFLTSFMELTGSLSYAEASLLANKSGQLTPPQGAPLLRKYAEDDIEWYVQDSWRVKPNLTLNYGLRYSYFGVPWEQNGLQTISNLSLDQWWALRIANMNQGIPADASPLLSFSPAGKANGKPSWYNPSKRNFAPRFSLAYSPGSRDGILEKIFGGPGKSSIRMGFGLYYDRMGGAIATDEAINDGDPGLVNFELTPVGLFSLASAPRFSGTCSVAAGCTGFPSLSTFFPNAPSSITFPFTPDQGIDNFDFAINQHLKTPYSYAMDFSIEREVGKGFTVEAAYVGNLGHRLLLKKDYGQYMGQFKDPQSGQTLWQAYNMLVKQMGPLTNQTPVSQITPIAWIQNLMPNMPNYAAGYFPNQSGISSLTPTQAFYKIVQSYAPDWSDALLAMDNPFAAGLSPWSMAVDPQQDGRVLFGPQFDSIPSWTSEGTSSFHSLQLSVRKRAGPLTLDVNYVFSKSIDDGSAAENADLFLGEGQVNGQIPNAFNVRAGRAVSDFNLRHNFNADWVYQLPFGRGKKFGSNLSGPVNAIVGNWQFTGTLRWHSGFPLTPRNGFNYATNDFQPGPGTIIGPLHTSVTKKDTPPTPNQNPVPNLFQNPAAVYAQVAYTLPGSAGSRNVVNGPSYFDTDLGLAKSFKMPWSEKQILQFRIETFNTFNNVNFGSTAGQFSSQFPGSQNPIDEFDVSAPASTFGNLFTTAGPLGGAREVQLGIRYDF